MTPLFEVLHKFWEKIKTENIQANKLFRQISNVKFFVSATIDSSVDELDLYACSNHTNINYMSLVESFIKNKSENAYNVWQEIIERYSHENDSNLFNQFFNDYLSISLKVLLPTINVYDKFKHYWNQVSKYQDMDFVIDNLKRYSNYYLRIINAQFEDIDIQNQFFKIRESSGQDAYPYLMEVMEDFECGHLTSEMFLDILKMISEYVENRTDGAQINFSNLSNELNKILASRIYS